MGEITAELTLDAPVFTVEAELGAAQPAPFPQPPPYSPLTPHLTGITGTFGVMERVLIDETKINLLELDENGEQTGEAAYFSTCSDAASYLSAHPGTNYDMQFGNALEIDRIADLTFQNLTNLRHVTLSDKIMILGAGAFQNCSGLLEVDAPQIKQIGEYCFQYCTSLAKISMPDVRSISNQAFIHCEALDNVSITTMQSPILSYTFGYCYSLKKIELSIKSQGIMDHAFADCRGLTELTLPEGVQFINSSAFTDCKSLTSVSLPGTLQSIQDRIFLGCTALETITIAKAEGSISGAPWGAPDAQVVWTGTAAQTNETEAANRRG